MIGLAESTEHSVNSELIEHSGSSELIEHFEHFEQVGIVELVVLEFVELGLVGIGLSE